MQRSTVQRLTMQRLTMQRSTGHDCSRPARCGTRSGLIGGALGSLSGRIAGKLIGSLFFCWMLTLAAGCGSNKPSVHAELARRHLQLNRPQLAIEALAKDDSAEGHYLKSIALQSLGQKEAARDQIREALTIDSDEPKYQGYEAVLDLSAGKKDAARTLIELFQTRPSSAALAFFVTRAYVAQGDIKGAISSFKLGLTLIDEVPEFMFHALQYAVTTEQSEIAKQLLAKLEQKAPQDEEFLRELLNVAVKAKLVEPAHHLLERITALSPQSTDLPDLRVKIELLLGRREAALVAAREAVKNSPDDLGTQLLLAEALLHADPKADRERELADLTAKHPEHPDFVRRYALYLVKAKRVPEAIGVINQGITRTKNPTAKAILLNQAIHLPIESGDAALAEKQLNQHRVAFSNPLVVEYFLGRILYLKGDNAGALEQFQKVVAATSASTSEADRTIAAECLAWQKRILSAQTANQQLKKAQEDLKKIMEPKKSKKG